MGNAHAVSACIKSHSSQPSEFSPTTAKKMRRQELEARLLSEDESLFQVGKALYSGDGENMLYLI